MWSAYLYQTVSGRIGPRLNYESLTWSAELNGIENIDLGLTKADLPAVDLRYWLAPWWAGVVVFWDSTPVVAGPILTRRNENAKSVTIGCGGIRSILASRLIVQEQSNWDNLAKSVVSYSGKSLGTIAKYVVRDCQIKPAGGLPISFPMPDETAANDADHERTYRGFNVSNLNVNDVLTKISNVLNGPDIMFKPRLISDNQLTFDMHYGTETQPRIAQKFTQVWDTTPASSQVSEMNIITTGTYQTNRVFSTGAGTDEGLLIKVETNTSPLDKQYPLLESVINVGNSENATIVRGHALSNLKANSDSLLEIQMTVRGDTDIPFGSFWPGDLAHVITKGWIALPDGLTKMRILSLTGDSTNNVKISLQKEDKFV